MMNVEEFEAQLKEELTAFVTMWKIEQAKNPSIFPEQMEWPDWFEQFEVFNSEEE